MDTRARGDIAEAAILHALAAADLVVCLPFGRFGPYDLAVELPTGFVRVQVKSGRLRGGCVEFNCVGTDHGRGAGSYAGRADVFAVHVHATGEQIHRSRRGGAADEDGPAPRADREQPTRAHPFRC